MGPAKNCSLPYEDEIEPPRPVFVYGSLLSDKVFAKVMQSAFGPTYVVPRRIAGVVLEGYKRVCVRNAPYPAIIPKDGSHVEGGIYFIQSHDETRLLDTFESDMYRRETIDARVVEENRVVEADVYVFDKDVLLLDDTPWSFEEFEKNHMNNWIESPRFDGGF